MPALCLGVLLAAASLAWGAAPARAGTYTVWSCRGPAGAPISDAAWQVRTENAAHGELSVDHGCAEGASLSIEMGPGDNGAGRSGELVFEPPTGTLISDFELWRYVAAGAGSSPEGAYAASLREWLVFGEGEGFVTDCGVPRPERTCVVGDPESPLDPENLVDGLTFAVGPEGSVPQREKLSLWVSCIGPSSACEPVSGTPSAVAKLFRSKITIEDDQAPTIERLEGSLTEAAPLTGTGHLLVTAGDVGGGIAGLEYAVDGGAPKRISLGNGNGGCEEPFTLPQPCPSEATRDIAIATAGLSPGAHSVTGTVTDAAGNSTPFGPVAFKVAAPPAEPPVHQPPEQEAPARGPATGMEVAAASAQGGRPNNGTPAVETPRIMLREVAPAPGGGKPGRLRGSLTTSSGEPISGARLVVEVSELGGAHRARKRQIRTDHGGHFVLAVGKTGARTVVVSYAPTVGGPVSRSAGALVKAPLSLSLTPRPRALRAGQTVHFHGRLRGAGGAAAGANVEIQAVAGGRWTTIETVSADRHGDFTWSHRFRYVERDALFSFRAVVPRTPGWPWATVKSGRVELPIEGAPR